ncbi:MAG: endonuclease [Candidatus Muproteobacteria bacterium RIFCSPHIGHO2_12_FULL_60_33]|uniref:Endonuclease n=1 Tax=Candidatus Muproteobacteria bacterium RIFCSPLOWO2_01_FULL_60_18 TaxID=1817768 RepID=A0A1F6U2Q2_9PROT|nr:MAG: endonuclease [Candidatus Muproteobacteria bacterium RIFCSPHIGHO2_01_60_12]OGI51664.1 MAG: endonuclease [Candidatus Muproteobacteria bacterium RIFCSPLOWO2_01_FULL_60_18]OGI54671.1 MAG: endonuclease [Candidatus Muproteobacteria bacterium RIFCSPHIGHO2_02_FULL_60_13]OGI56463.1 MAG: endonuclease [Candidatus Muproteobacteria bacterium RIFCSPHIGHO2_12_FULL_60_33]
MRARHRIREVYEWLFAANGHQRWWPGDSTFEIMVGAVLTQNTAWTNVERAISNLIQAKALSPEVIVRAHPRRLAAWLRPSGYFNIKAKRLKALCRWVMEQGGVKKLARLSTDQLRHALLDVHGIGPETADDILLYAFNRPVFVIDAYTRRIFARLGLIAGDEHYEALRGLFESELEFSAPLFNEYHALIVAHGKDVCKKRPLCGNCSLAEACPSVAPHKSARD